MLIVLRWNILINSLSHSILCWNRYLRMKTRYWNNKSRVILDNQISFSNILICKSIQEQHHKLTIWHICVNVVWIKCFYSSLIFLASGYMIHANMFHCYEVARSRFVFLSIDGDSYIIALVLFKGPFNKEGKWREKETWNI